MPGPIVKAARRPAVRLDGEAAGGPGFDVVDLAVLGGDVAELVEAFAVSDHDRPPGGAAEQTPTHTHVDDP